MRTIEGLQRDFRAGDVGVRAVAETGSLPAAGVAGAIVSRLLAVSRTAVRTRVQPSRRSGGAARQSPGFVRRRFLASGVDSRPACGVRALFRTIERALPPGEIVERILREQNPDVLLLTPLLVLGSPTGEYVRAARALGIRSVLASGAGNHLTTKGLIHEPPVASSSGTRCSGRKPRSCMGFQPIRVDVTGAQAYDTGSQQKPSIRATRFSRGSASRPTGRCCCTCARRRLSRRMRSGSSCGESRPFGARSL